MSKELLNDNASASKNKRSAKNRQAIQQKLEQAKLNLQTHRDSDAPKITNAITSKNSRNMKITSRQVRSQNKFVQEKTQVQDSQLQS